MTLPAFDHPGLLWALPLALLPLWRAGPPVFEHADLGAWPTDPLSRWMDRGLRVLASVTVMLLVVAAATPWLEGGTRLEVGRGAQIVVAFDRSGSMSEPLVGQDVDDPRAESKIAAARRILLDFMKQRLGDAFGLVVFNASPISAAPLGEDRGMLEAALHSAETRSMGFTALGRALGLALEEFRDRPVTAARLVLLVSDGGAVIRRREQALLRQLFTQQHASLIWIYTRGAREPSVIDADQSSSTDSLGMHRFFETLGVPYQVFEVTSAAGLERAVRTVASLTNLPTRYARRLPRRDLAAPLYLAAWMGMAVLVTARMAELRAWSP